MMKTANKFELHYYFEDQSHEIDALIRNKCETELLSVIYEAAKLLDIDTTLIKTAYMEGGFRDIWKAIGGNSAQITILLLIVQIIISSIPHLNSESNELEIEERKLSIEEKKLNIKKLKQEIDSNDKQNNIDETASNLGTNLKIGGL